MFISVSGFQDDGITLPEYLRPNPNPNQPENTAKQVVFCLIRWLEPHPDARLRDAEGRPVCPAPFDINHSLWRFARLRRPRACFSPDILDNQIRLFPGRDDAARRMQTERHKFAYYDLLSPETFVSYMNCTILNEETGTILETNTLPCNLKHSKFE